MLGKKENHAKIILLFIILVWGLNTPVMKIGLLSMSPLAYNACRLVVTAVLSVALMFATRTYKPMPLRDLLQMAKIGLLGFFFNQFFIMYGLDQTTAGNSSLVFATLPVEVALINWMFGMEAVSRRMMAGIVTGLSGVFIVVLGSGKEFSLLGPHLMGAMLLLVGQFCFGYYTVFVRGLADRYSINQIFAYITVFSAGLFFVVSLPDLMATRWSSVSDTAVYSILFSSIFAQVIANTVWIWVVGRLGSTKASLSQYLCPVVSIAFAWVYLDETLGLLQGIGAAVILTGLYLVLNQPLRYFKQSA
ncbi:MAG: EamA family transporter [Negativicutes bacterium]|nr:EamA family transporter [Negativicutes bacterium]MDR3591107.1 EamA family transporter [Negativicutes bacterium]